MVAPNLTTVMKFSFITNMIIRACLLVHIAFTVGASNTNLALKKVTENSDKFSMDLYMSLKKNNGNANTIVSPLALQIVLAMTAHGAGGKTKKEINDAVHLPRYSKTLLTGYQALLESLTTVPEMKMANNIFMDEVYAAPVPQFNTAMSDYFSSSIERIIMYDSPGPAAKRINSWVKEHTEGKITQLFGPDDLDKAVIVLVSAIYFKAAWDRPFPAHRTRDDFFFTSQPHGAPIDVKMMVIKDWFNYAYVPELQSKILELPYKNGRFSMVIILPDEIRGLQLVENKLKSMGISRAMSYLEEKKVLVKMPKFKIESDMLLKDNLKELGIRDMFDKGKCNLTGMAVTEYPIYVSMVKQKAFIEVAERGTEAAAVSGVKVHMVKSSVGHVPEEGYEVFTVDHQFFYAIYAHHGSLRIPIFVGSVKNPSF